MAKEPITEVTAILDFITKRKLNVRFIETCVDICPRTIQLAINGERNLPKKHVPAITKFLVENHGFETNSTGK